MEIFALGERRPRLDITVFIAPTASVIGDVVLDHGVNVWFGVVIRADETLITIGPKTNIQDGSIIHSNAGGPRVTIGGRVTVGHGARLHGCRIESEALIGIGAIVLDEAVIESGAIVAAGALVPPGARIRADELWAGVPAVFKRATNSEERRMLRESPEIYLQRAREYKFRCWQLGTPGIGVLGS